MRVSRRSLIVGATAAALLETLSGTGVAARPTIAVYKDPT